MRLNEKKIVIQPYISKTIGDELVLYNEMAQKIVVANHSAALIWNEIIDTYHQQKNLTTQEIASLMCRRYNIHDMNLQDICNDVDKIINLFIDASLLEYDPT